MIEAKYLLKELRKAKLITALQQTAIQETARKRDVSVERVIREKGLVPDDVFGQFAADLYAVPFVDLTRRSVHDNTLRIIPEVVARSQMMIPFRQDDQYVFLALSEPDARDKISYVEKLTGKIVKPHFATEAGIMHTLAQYKSQLSGELTALIGKKTTSGKRIVMLLDTIFAYAFANRASDIHIEPLEHAILIRFRIDGELHDVAELPLAYLEEIISRIKVLARLRTDEHASAQDGKFRFTYEQQEADIRVSIVPITVGEKIVMRILSEQSRSFNLEELGFDDRHMAIVTKHMKRPYGMILATGPTGSGKTSTLYAIVKKINSRSINISTIEDPVEFDIDGVNQIQVNPKTNVTFAQGLKAILRQDPDVIMVGEIRDEDTAGIAINAAMTGHMVLSTLHTNDAPTALPRLLDMKIEPFLIASTVNLIIAQRLVRRLCASCMESYVPNEKELSRLIDPLTPQERSSIGAGNRDIRLFKSKGCDVCHSTGYNGRIGIFELMEMNEDIRAHIMQRSSSDEIRKTARTHHMHSMYYDGIRKALEGKTSIEEILKATSQ